MARDNEWRKKEPSLHEVAEKYSELPFTWITKIDAQRRGVTYSKAARELVDPALHQTYSTLSRHISNGAEHIPEGLTLSDGSYIVFNGLNFDTDFSDAQRDPYVVDVIDGKTYLTDNGEVLDEVTYWEKPDFFDKKASNGQPFSAYAQARPQRLNFSLCSNCHFWDTPGEGCKYCSLCPNFKLSGKKEEQVRLQYVREAAGEALKQKGRYSSIMFSGGSILSGKELFDDEVDGYIELINTVGEFFELNKRFPSQILCSAFNEKQLERLYNSTGIMTYTTDLEILDEEKFNWICPGKARHVGYNEWKRRLYAAVEIFGRGNVNSGIVLGAELAKPNGFKTEDEAYERITETAQELGENGVSIAAAIWKAAENSIFQNQDTPTLDYYIKTLKKFDEIHHENKLGKYIDDYRRCGNHPGYDLVRI